MREGDCKVAFFLFITLKKGLKRKRICGKINML